MTDVLPMSLESERLVIGSVLQDDVTYAAEVAELSIDDFSLEKHRRIWRRIEDLHGRGERVDQITVYEELDRNGEAESDDLGYLVSLDDGLPRLRNLGSYARILREKARLRRIRFAGQNLMDRCAAGETSAEIIAAAQELFTSIGARGQSQSIGEIPAVSENGAADVEYIRPELPKGAMVALTGDAGRARVPWRPPGCVMRPHAGYGIDPGP